MRKYLGMGILLALCSLAAMSVYAQEGKGKPGPKGDGGGQAAAKSGASDNGGGGGEKGGQGGGGKSAPKAPSGPKKKPLKSLTQVQLQVFISEMNEQGMRTIGTNLSYNRVVRGEEQSGSVQEIGTNTFSPSQDFERGTLPVPLAGRGLRPKDNLGGFGLTGSVINTGYGTLDFMFRGLERKADMDLVSKPELLVVDGGQAGINAGGRIPYQAVKESKGKDSLSVQWRDIGVNMRLTPRVLSNNLIELTVSELNVKELSRLDRVRGLDLPVFAERSQTGNVLVPNGQTLVIGGLTSERRVPILGKLPVMGMAFRSRRSEADFSTLMIFVSPTIVDVRNVSREADSALAFWKEKETEWANEDRIDEEYEKMQKSSSLW